MNQFPHPHAADLRKHMQQHRILAHIPVICHEDVLGPLIQNPVEHQRPVLPVLRHIKRHAVGTRIQIHLVQILMHVQVCHNTPAERIMLQIVEHPVHLIHHPLPVLMLYAELIAVRFSD